MSEENTNQQQAEVQTSAEIKVEDTGSQEIQSPEVVEVPWEKLQETFQMREALRETQNYTSEFILQTERRKRRLLAEIDSIERAMYESATEIRNNFSLNSQWTYEFKLPNEAGEKGYFIRKEAPSDTI
tara:strand:- start:409 stop:792 length:384 start_codon:yes stop_codon:yes gene_type:complete